MIRTLIFTGMWAFFLSACSPAENKETGQKAGESKTQAVKTPKKEVSESGSQSKSEPAAKATTQSKESEEVNFVEISNSDDVHIDIKYATKDNFTHKVIYPCGKCYLRPEAAKRILAANEKLQKEYGYKLKMFDCYRPRPAQQRLWDVVPNADYVTPPSKGSMHNRGVAVDLTVVDKNGKELDMGTPYDFFGPEAHTDNMKLPKQVLINRDILKKALLEQGFKGIRTEWWHFSFNEAAELSDWEWPCN